MAGNLLGEPFRDYVNGQIKIRQQVHGRKNRSIQDIQYLNSRNAWIKLASGVSIEQKRLDLLEGNPLLNGVHKGQDLAINNVLFNGLTRMGKTTLEEKEAGYGKGKETHETYTTTFNQQQRSGIKGSNRAYGVGGTGQFGYSPMPGIIDMNFKCLNRGSIKRATLNIKAHNKNQFDVIDVLYLRLGYSVFLEWGYDKYINNDGRLIQMGDTLIDGPFWEDKYQKSNYTQWLPEIEKMREETNGNYDGAFGIVSNFSWTFEDDGTYNIKLEIINLGDVIESLKVNLPSVVPDNVDPFSANKFNSLLQEYGTDQDVPEVEFYNGLYPGLKQSITEWYRRSIGEIDGNVGDAPNITLKYSFGQLRYGTVGGSDFDKKDGKDNLIKPTTYESFFSIPSNNTFFNVGTTSEYENPNKDIFTEGGVLGEFDASQEDIRAGIKWALANWYFIKKFVHYWFDSEEGRGHQIFKAWEHEPGSEYNSQFEKLSVQLQDPPTTDVDTTPGRLRKANYPIPFPETDANGKKSVNYYTYSSLRSPGNNNVDKSIYPNTFWEEWTDKLSDIPKTTYKWDFILQNKGNNDVKFGPGLEYILTYVYRHFKRKNKAKLLPPTKESEELKEKGKFMQPQSKQELEQIVEQQSKDLQNRNKNRIYRFFYDIRKPNLEGGANNITSTKNSDIVRINDDKVIGKFLSGTELLKQFSPEGSLEGYNNEQLENLYNTSFGKFSLPVVYLDKILPLKNQWYMKLGVFLKFLEKRVIPKVPDKNGAPMIKIDTDERKNICYVIDNVYSLDIRKCIAYNRFFSKGLDENENKVLERNFTGLDNFVTKTGITENAIYYGQIMNIYFSFSRLEEIFDSVDTNNEVSLYKALKNICTDINESFGNINNIEPIVNEDNIIKFIDQSHIPGLNKIRKTLSLPIPDPLTEAVFDLYGYNIKNNTSNFVRKIGLTTEISKNYATMITIGATANGSIPGAEATAFSRWNIGLKDRFKNNVVDALDDGKGGEAPISSSASYQIRTKYASLMGLTDTPTAKLGLDEGKGGQYIINEDTIEYNKNVVEDFYKLAQSESSFEKDKDGNPINSIESSVGFLPFNLKLDIDGLSGIKIYNKITVESSFLPSNYPETLEFIITGVNHKLSDNDWVTSLETTATSANTLTKK